MKIEQIQCSKIVRLYIVVFTKLGNLQEKVEKRKKALDEPQRFTTLNGGNGSCQTKNEVCFKAALTKAKGPLNVFTPLGSSYCYWHFFSYYECALNKL